jgi:hypothetical protein
LLHSAHQHFRRAIAAIGPRALLVVPAVVLLGFILIYGGGAPAWDHLGAAEIFQRWYTHDLTPGFLFSQHNEHRTTVPRLIILGLGLLTRFNHKAEMLAVWASACAVAWMLLVSFTSDVRARSLLLFAPIAWMVFSLRPYEVIFDADGPYFSMVFLVGALTLLAATRTGWTRLSLAALSGLLASFSQSNGLLVWPIGALMIGATAYTCGDEDRRREGWQFVVWVMASLAVVGSYFHGYVDPPNHPSPVLLIQHPVRAVEFFAVLSAGSLAPDASSAAGSSLVLFALEGATLATLALWCVRDRERPPLGAFLILAAIAMNVMITLNRAGGIGAAGGLTSRYAAYSALGPIGVYWCAVARRDRLAIGRGAATVAATLLVIGYLTGSINTFALRNWLYGSRRWLAYELYTAKYQPLSTLTTDLYPNPYHARAYAEILERYRLSVFADAHVNVDALPAGGTPLPFALQWVNGKPFQDSAVIEVGPEDSFTVRGWALDADGRRSAGAVFVNIDDRVDLPGCVGLERDTARESISRSLKWTAFGASFGGFVLPPGRHVIRFKIVSADLNVFFLTQPLLQLTRH